MTEPHDNALYQAILQRIRSSPLRLTQKRERVLRTMLQLDRPESAANIRDLAGLPESDLVTVYRNLESFLSLGVAQRIPLENGSHLFELTSPGDHHHHFICRHCHRAERLDYCVAQEVESHANALGFSEVTHVLEVYGTCRECGGAAAHTKDSD